MGSLWSRAVSGLKTVLLTWFIGVVLLGILGVLIGESKPPVELVRPGFSYPLLFSLIAVVVVVTAFVVGVLREKAA